MSGHELSETQRLTGDIGQYLFDEWCQSFGDFTFGGEKFRTAYAEDIETLGLDSDDPYLLIIIRERDGKAFEVELEASVYPVPTKAERERQARELMGQMRLPRAAS
jgi:hypothetical protein